MNKKKRKIAIVNNVMLTQLLLSILISIFIILKNKEINLFYIVGFFIGISFTFFLEHSCTKANSRKIYKKVIKTVDKNYY